MRASHRFEEALADFEAAASVDAAGATAAEGAGRSVLAGLVRAGAAKARGDAALRAGDAPGAVAALTEALALAPGCARRPRYAFPYGGRIRHMHVPYVGTRRRSRTAPRRTTGRARTATR